MSRSNHKEGTTVVKRIFAGLALTVVALGFATPAFATDTTVSTVSTPVRSSAASVSAVHTTVISASVASGYSNGKLVIADDPAPKPTKIVSSNCKWVNHGYNSGKTQGGKRYWFKDNVRAKVCKNTSSPTGWVKVAGGMSGRKCFNPYALPKAKVPGPVVTKFVLIRAFAASTSTVKTTAYVNQQVMATASCRTPNTSASALAYGNGRVLVTATASANASTRSSAITAASKAAARNLLQMAKTDTRAFAAAKLDLVAKAFATCYEVPVTQVTCSAGNTPSGLTCVKAGNTTPPEAPQPVVVPQPAPAPQPVVVIQPAPAPQPCDVGSTRDSSGVCVKNAATTPAPVANPIPAGTTTPVGIDPAPAPSGSPAPVDAPPYVAPAPSQCYDATGATVPSTDPTALFCS